MHRRQGRRGPSALTVARRIRRAPAHRALLAFCLAVLVVLLAVQGIALQSTGAERGARGDGSSPLAGSAPVVSWSGSRLVALSQPPGRRIALTFDDGPDPRWTPAIEAVLRRYGATATFFEVGSAVVRHPGITRELRAHGFELGNHTFSHLNVARAAGWVRSWQLGLTENAITGAAGVSPRLMRFPYSSHASDVTAGQLPAVEDVARAGYLVVFCQYDTHDWERPGAASIVQAATPPAGSGGIVMMHDAGGDRSQTVAALARLLPSLKARGYSFVHVSDLVGLAPRAVAPAASGWQGARGWFLIVTLGVAAWVTAAVTFVVAPIAVLALLRALIVALIAGRQARRRRRPDTGFAPPLSIVVPAFNEAVGIERSVRSLAASDYPDFEIVVVDDGSSDGTAEIVEALELPRVRVIRQSNAGKPAAINAGATAARHEVIVCVDADTIFERGTLRALVPAFAEPDVGAIAGNTKVGNRRGLLGRWQHIEYVMGFNLDRRLYDLLRCMPTVPGAIGAFRREALLDIGGVSSATLAEDTDITVAIGRAGWRVVYAERARAWTEAPATLSALWRQRQRWAYGTLQAVWKHRAALWTRGERRLGWLGLAYLTVFQILLPLLAPLIDVFAIYGIVFLDPASVIGYWLAFNAINIALALFAFRLDGESPRPLWSMPLQQFVYRQLMYLVVVESVVSALLGTRVRWGHLERTGKVEVVA